MLPISSVNTRRSFFSGTAASLAASSIAASAADRENQVALTPTQRRRRAFQLRRDAAETQRDRHLPLLPTNGDEQRYLNRIASFSKGLPHNDLGEVDASAYDALFAACDAGSWQALEAVPLGGVVKLANPLAALAYSTDGGDSHQFDIPAAPAFASAEAAGELVEVYWRALTRDVPFSEYATSPLIAEAAEDCSRLTDFRGLKVAGKVTPEALFRGHLPGESSGPLLSQFLLADIPYGSSVLSQRWRTFPRGADYATSLADTLALQRGAQAGAVQRDPVARYIRNLRDLAAFVHLDYTFEAFVHAALILGGLGASAASPANPYFTSKTMGGFATFGAPMVLDLVTRTAVAALKAAWCQKWMVHRRLRPEAMALRLHQHLTNQANYPLHPDLLNAKVLPKLRAENATYLLPLAYPEGSPTHPSYPGGHATIAGAAITVLKALFNESAPYPAPMTPSDDGQTLNPLTGASLTIGGELNKLASNMALGRDSAGVHFRADETAGLALGEAVAIEQLREAKATFAEDLPDFRFTRFDGVTERV